MSIADQIYEQVKALPEQLARQVLDFASHLRAHQGDAEWRDLMAGQSKSLGAVWDNDEDEIWNTV